MTFGLGVPAFAGNTKAMQFSLSSNEASASPKSGTGWEMASADQSGGSCQSSKYIGGGTFLTLSAQKDHYALTVENSRDQFDVWKDYDVTLRVDGVSSAMTVRPIKFDTFVVPVSIASFKGAQNFDIGIGNRHYTFTEAKMAKVVSKLEKCTGVAVSSSTSTNAYAQMAPASGDTSAPVNDTKAATPATPANTGTAVPMMDAVPGTLAPVSPAPTPLDAAVTTAKDAAATNAKPALDAKPLDTAVPQPASITPATTTPVAATPAVVAPVTAPTTTAPAVALPVTAATPAPAAAAAVPTTPAATSAPTALTAPADAAKTDTAAAEKAPAVKSVKKKAKAAAPAKPKSETEATADEKIGRTYAPQGDAGKPCVQGQKCPISPTYTKDASTEKALVSNVSVPEQTVTEIKPPIPVLPAVIPPASSDSVPAVPAGAECTSSDEYKNLVRKIGLLEAEKEQLRSSSGTTTMAPALQKVAQCASESYQIKELKTELDIIKKENADLRHQAEAVKGADNLNDALNELDETVKNGKK